MRIGVIPRCDGDIRCSLEDSEERYLPALGNTWTTSVVENYLCQHGFSIYSGKGITVHVRRSGPNAISASHPRATPQVATVTHTRLHFQLLPCPFYCHYSRQQGHYCHSQSVRDLVILSVTISYRTTWLAIQKAKETSLSVVRENTRILHKSKAKPKRSQALSSSSSQSTRY